MPVKLRALPRPQGFTHTENQKSIEIIKTLGQQRIILVWFFQDNDITMRHGGVPSCG